MNTQKNLKVFFKTILVLMPLLMGAAAFAQNDPWIHFQPPANIDNGKHIVLISGDEAYRSEESLPMLAKILSTHHGFKTTVLFSVNPETKFIDPDYHQNIPGLQFLKSADLMIIATRFRELPDEQMQFIDQYLTAGKPVIGLRTATHAFHYSRNPKNKYSKYGYKSSEAGWEGGFGKRILGETWISHHGVNGKEGTRGLINGMTSKDGQLILQGVQDIWTTTEVYRIKSLPSNSQVLVWGQSTNGLTDESPGIWEKSIMPVAWIREYSSESGKRGKVFTTTMGAAIDFLSEDLRRLLVNASYWATDLENDIPAESNVDFIGDYKPTMFGMGGYIKSKTPQDYK